MNNVIGVNEIKQIEKWTNMRIENIIFDSDVDNWKEGASEFDKKVLNKSNLIFLIEDENGNLFGAYVNAIINKYHKWIKDTKSFVFSLKSNEVLNEMLKFNISFDFPEYAFYLCHRSDDYNRLFLIGSGNDIHFCKENHKKESYCDQASFNYNGIRDALRRKSDQDNFTPIRIAVIQLI